MEGEGAPPPSLTAVAAPPDPDLPTSPGRRGGPRRDQVIVGDDLRLDEATFDVAVDDAGGLGRLRSLPNRPGTHFRIARGEEGDEVQQSIGGMDEGRERRLFQTRVFEEDGGLVIR